MATALPKGYLPDLHGFRGVAIITIVCAHCWSFLIFMTGGVEGAPRIAVLFEITETLFHGSTLFFALISGLLFTKVLQGRGWPAFFKSKLLNVFSPYFCFTLFFTGVFWKFWVQGAAQQGRSIEFLPTLAENLLLGKASPHYWYIPVLFAMYLLTPAFSKLLKSRYGLWAGLVLVALPLVVSRGTFPYQIDIYTVVYFSGAYVAGMLMGLYYHQAHDFLARYQLLLWLVIAVCSVIFYTLLSNDYQRMPHFSFGQSAIYLQKMALAGVILHWLARHQAHIPRLLTTLGTFAFTIYFIHMMFIWSFNQAISEWITQNRAVWSILAIGILNLLISISLSLVFTWIMKKLTGRFSKMIIGS